MCKRPRTCRCTVMNGARMTNAISSNELAAPLQPEKKKKNESDVRGASNRA